MCSCGKSDEKKEETIENNEGGQVLDEGDNGSSSTDIEMPSFLRDRNF